MPYDQGNTVRVRATFTDSDSGELVDPGSFSWTVYDPHGTATVIPGEQDGVGMFSTTFIATLSGDYTVVFSTTGPVQVQSDKIVINPVPMVP